ncbi:MAG: methyltransferase domain-containing protein [Verrucomicrobiota bacterium]
MSSFKPCCTGESSKPNLSLRVAFALTIITLGIGISLHLHANHVSHWWLPLVLLVVAHGVIVGGMTWLIAQLFHNQHRGCDQTARCCGVHGHKHGEQSKVIHSPHLYDWFVRILALGGERKFRQRTLDLSELRPGETVLDVGCGTGTLLIEAAKRIGPGGLAHGIEPSTEMVAHARKKAEAQAVTVSVMEGSADHLTFPDASFDVVFCTMVLHHLPSAMQAATILEMIRVLRPTGRIVIVDLQRPKTIKAALSLVTLVHQFGSHATTPDWQRIEPLLKQYGVHHINTHAMLCGAVNVTIARRLQSDQS